MDAEEEKPSSVDENNSINNSSCAPPRDNDDHNGLDDDDTTNVIVMSDSGKPIFASNRNNEEEEMARICSLLQAVRTSIVYSNNSLMAAFGELQSLSSDHLLLVFMTVGSITLVAISSNNKLLLPKHISNCNWNIFTHKSFLH